MADDGRVFIRIVDNLHSHIALHPSLCQRLELRNYEHLQIVHGKIMQDISWIADEKCKATEVAIGRTLAKQLLLDQYPKDIFAHIKKRQLRIGPLIGILCNPSWNAKKQTMHSSTQLAGLTKLVQVGEAFGSVCFLFRLPDVDFKKATLTAYLLTKDGWIERTLPLPDAIYDQIISRKLEQKENWGEKRRVLSEKYGNAIFNDGFFDKLQVYAWLSNDPKMKVYIPDTMRHTSNRSAVSFLSKYPTIFLKPVHGSLGVGITRFIRQQDGAYIYDLKNSTTSLLHGRARNAPDAVKLFERRLRRKPYLWQEGISLLLYKDRPLDIRILLQRDGTGEWKRTKMFARVAKVGDFTSNLSGGGEALPLESILSEVYRTDSLRRKCKYQITAVSKLTAKTLEQQSGKTYGELGIDLGLDTFGNVWVIEVNAKPRKTPTTEKGRQDLVDLAFERPIRYAIRLALGQ